ncbi:hypothetical protein [Streptomyces hiroshimensis]|uniref:Fido domain-containing protein n=1 Tax=Streptomyces hiroshimensis TaxID=66424 RepID=A0ABQ2YBJ7_9ACTN|nr:hypothetical protein [Streptomyces hiroshimensis]GGX79068.1 hypothetical protein GCM10010324_25790 [Streptomyces hiroshimensis]
MFLRIDARWIEDALQQFEQQSGLEIGIDDWGALATTVYRHAYELHAGEPFYVETPVRAAVLLQTFVALQPLADYNGLVGSTLAVRYMRESGEPVKPPAGGMTKLVAGIRENRLTLRATAALLRSWVA